MATFPQDAIGGAKAEIMSIRERRQELRSQPRTIDLEDFIPAKAQVICVASGKGGTGKTIVASNLAVLMARRGLRVTLVDADFGLANAHLVLGMNPKHDVSAVVRGELSIDRVCERGPCGVRLVPGGSGRAELTVLAGDELSVLAGELYRLEESSDVIIVDLGAGINPQVLKFLNAAHDIVLVTDHEATARSDAMAAIGVLADILGAATIHVVMNRVRDREHSVVAFQKLWGEVNRRWLSRIKLYFSGWMPENWYVKSSVILGKPLVLAHPRSLPARCLGTMAEKLCKHHAVWRNRQIGRWGARSAFARLAEMSGSSPSLRV